MSRIHPGDGNLHWPSGEHREVPPQGTVDATLWYQRLREHEDEHKVEHRRPARSESPWAAGRHQPGGLRTPHAEP